VQNLQHKSVTILVITNRFFNFAAQLQKVDLFGRNTFLTGLVLLVIILTSCEKFEGNQTIPAYLQVDTIFLTSNPLIEEGVLTHRFVDVWAFVDDQLIGAFELPATIPILAQGKHKVALYAGIKNNGMSGTRGYYLMTKPWVNEEYELVMDSVVRKNPSVMFFDNTQFEWIEDFEGSSFKLEVTSNSDTSLQSFNHSPADPVYGLTSGAGYMDSESPIFEITTKLSESPGFDFPPGGHPVYLEMEYNTNNLMSVGIFIKQYSSGIIQHPILILNSTEGEWKKVYVNLTPSVDEYQSEDYFNVYFRSDKESGVENPVIKLDNLKLIHRYVDE